MPTANFFGEESLWLTPTEAGLKLRPLLSRPIPVKQHSIPKAAGVDKFGKPSDIRKYKSVSCPAKMGGGSCIVCTMQDPLWSKLQAEDKYDRQNRRVDFPYRDRFFLPVWDYTSESVKILAGSRGMFNDMADYAGSGGDICACDWIVKKEPNNTRFKYSYKAIREDKSDFPMTPDILAKVDDCKKVIATEVSPPDPAWVKRYIAGESTEELNALPSSAGIGSFAGALPPPPPPAGSTPDDPAKVLMVPIMRSPDGNYVLTGANTWVLATDAVTNSFRNANLL